MPPLPPITASTTNQQADALARCLFEESSDAILLFDRDSLRVVEANSAASQSLQRSREQLASMEIGSLLRSETDTGLTELLGRCRGAGRFASADPYDCPLPDGDHHRVSVTVRSLSDGPTRTGVLMLRPVSEIDSPLKTVFEQAAVGVALTESGTGRFVKLNEKCLRLLGFGEVEMMRKSIADVVHPDDSGQLNERLGKLAAGELSEFGIEVRLIRNDASIIWARLTVSTAWQGESRPQFHVAIVEDITSRKLAEEEWGKSRRALANAQSRACMGSWEFFPDNGDTIWSNEMFRLYNLDPHREVPESAEAFVELVHPEDRKTVLENYSRIWESDQLVANFDLRTNPEVGPMRWLDASLTRVPNETMKCGFHVAGTVMDVTDRKMAETALRSSEHRFRTLCKHSAMGIFLADVDGNCTYLNESGCAIIGRSQEQSAGNGWAEALHPDDRNRVLVAWQNAVQSCSDFDSEFRFLHSNGDIVWARIRSSLRRDDSGNSVGHVGSFVNVTSHKIALERLEQSEQRYRTLVETAPEAIVVFDQESQTFVDYNDNALALFRCKDSDLRGAAPWDFCPETQPDGGDSRTLAGEYLARAVRGERFSFEWTHQNAEGITFPCEVRLARFHLGSRVLVRGSITDISDRKKSEQQLRMTRFALESTDDAMFVVDNRARIVDVNSVASSRLGYSREEFLRMSVFDVNPSFVVANWDEHWQNVKRLGRLVVEATHRTRSGVDFPVELSVSYFEFEGKEYGFAFVRDVSQRKETEERLRERETQLAHVSRLSTMGEMVAGIAHELNQPLYSIVNYSKAISNVLRGGASADTKSPPTDNSSEPLVSIEQVQDWNEQIGKAAMRAGKIIRRLRGFVQRETTYLPTNLHNTIGDALELVRHESDRSGITLRANLVSPGPVVNVDSVQIQQVLVNLLINAIEAIEQSDSARREIDVTTVMIDDQIRISVSDSGPGIPREAGRSLFAAFETTKSGGMGMGLAISNTIIETFGGRLWAENHAPKGATFHFTLPIDPHGGKHDS